MSYLAILLAAAAAYGFGAVWYMVLAKPWMTAAGMTPDKIAATGGRGNPKPYIVSAVCMLVVAGMMRHIFIHAGVDTVKIALFAGFGLGIGITTPWIVTNYTFAQRPLNLMLIDCGFACIGCTLMGLVLVLVGT